jgi:hypothetical protein
MALSVSAAAGPIATAGAALVDLKPIASFEGKRIMNGRTYPAYGLAAVPTGVAGGGVFVGDQTGGCSQVDAAGREVRRLIATGERVLHLCVAHGKLFVAHLGDHQPIEAFSAVSGESLGVVETTADLDNPACVLIVNDLMVVFERRAIAVWPLPRRWMDP